MTKEKTTLTPPLRPAIFLAYSLLGLLLTQCAHGPLGNEAQKEANLTPPVAKTAEFPEVLPEGRSLNPPPSVTETKLEEILSAEDEVEQLTLDDVIRIDEPDTKNLYDNSRYDFPITLNPKVEQWIDYFTGRGRHHMDRYLARSRGYTKIMRQIFSEEGIPSDLVFLCLIESGFNVRARSRVGATGAWQFMKATGKRYGLKIDFWIDERRDPIRSTRAAAKYLKDLYLMFESWYLAASAYNSGEYRVLRAIDNAKSNNYWHLSKRKLLPRETRNYVPKLIAAAIIGKNPKKFNFNHIEYDEPLTFETVSIDYPVYLKDIAQLVGASHEEMLDLNPELLRGMVPPDIEEYQLRVPAGKQALTKRTLIAKKKELNKPVMPVQYRVQRGDTLIRIARNHGVTVSAIKEVNKIRRRNRIYPGQKLVIPAEIRPDRKITRVRKKFNKVISKASKPKGFETKKTHVVQKGESLWSIAEKYNVTVRNLFKWNDLRRSRIHPGKKLEVWQRG